MRSPRRDERGAGVWWREARRGPRGATVATLLRGSTVATLLLAAACRSGPPDPAPAGDLPPRAAPTAARPSDVPRVFDVASNLSRCDVEHRGLLFDLGSPAVEGLEAWKLGPNADVSTVEREGASWARVSSRSLSYAFTLDRPQPLFVSARVRGLASRSAQVLLDGKPFGSLAFSRNQTRVVSTPLSAAPVPAGLHTLGLRWQGGGRGAEPFAEVDWLRLGVADDDPSSFAAPTQRDVAQNVALKGVPHRALALRAPGRVRCALGLAKGARLRASVGVLGAGEGDAEARLEAEGEAPILLRTEHVSGGDQASWVDWDLPLDAREGRVVTLELSAPAGARGARVIFGDPTVVAPSVTDARAPRARAAVVVVLTGVDPARLPPFAPDKPLPTFDALAREGVVFQAHRSPTSVTSGAMASLVTGLSPRQHALEDAYARLPASLPTLATLARDASAHTAMFSANPGSFEAFGFARGWDRFVTHSPVSPDLATAPLDDLVTWLGERGQGSRSRLLAVAHTRGIHPPFDVTPGEFAQMPPQEYAGPLDPRRAGQVLERYRQKQRSGAKWSAADAQRLSALVDAALVRTDRALSNLLDALRKTELWNETLLIVTADVAAAADPDALPFAEPQDLSEGSLHVPLYVRFPGGALAGKRVIAPTTTVDITKTVLDALGLDGPDGSGTDLYALASHDVAPAERPLEATLGDRFATRWGALRLSGRDGSAPSLCRIDEAGTCSGELLSSMPQAALALWRWTYDHEALGLARRPKREPATIDPDTAAALAVWGR
ncbi:MAG: sulfatase-like hydrolase/transferase [Polyangiaceae bacterium]|nr:sulfatase-like hydrolase/transferase [Polyangiaceae bacterium]